ncbi:MAG: OsmC family protein [Phycisphaerales bacterium]
MTATLTSPLVNGIDTDALRGFVDAVAANPREGACGFRVATRWQGGTKTCTRVDDWTIAGQTHPRGYVIHTDEPNQLCGQDSAPNPQEVLMAGINACMTVGYAALCALEGIELESLEIECAGDLDLRGFLGLDDRVIPGYESIRTTVRIKGSGTAEQFERIHQQVMKTSPNFFNISRPVRVDADLVVG